MGPRSTLRLLFFFVHLSASAPVYPRLEPPETTGWRAQPIGRGTFQIVLSCILTLGLCVWTSIHLNVEGGMTVMDHLGHKFRMAAMALFLPETIVSEAWEEWKQTRQLHRALIYQSWEKRRTTTRPSAEKKKGWRRVTNVFVVWLEWMGVWVDYEAFPKEVAFFVIMKGFVRLEGDKEVPVTAFEFFHAFKQGTIVAVYPTRPPVGGGPDKKDKLEAGIVAAETNPLPPYGWCEKDPNEGSMAITKVQPSPDHWKDRKYGETPSVPVIKIKISDVRDKGKSSVLAKLIICGQVAWMVLQLLGRRVSRLPMTLLELHTLIHIMIAVIMFWLWWYKPLDVGEPIVLALGAPPTNDEQWSERPQRFQSTGMRNFIDNLWLLPPVTIGGDDTAHVEVISSDDKPVDSIKPAEDATKPVVDDKTTRVADAPPSSKWRTIWNKIQVPQVIKNTSKKPADTAAKPLTTTSEEFRIWKKQSVEIMRKNTIPCIFYFVYAGLHAVVWSEYFSTPIEKWFWRGACLVVGVAPSLVVCLAILFRLIPVFFPHSLVVKDVQELVERSISLIYLLASIQLVIQSLISLRRLPVEVYSTVPWTAYIPHF